VDIAPVCTMDTGHVTFVLQTCKAHRCYVQRYSQFFGIYFLLQYYSLVNSYADAVSRWSVVL